MTNNKYNTLAERKNRTDHASTLMPSFDVDRFVRKTIKPMIAAKAEAIKTDRKSTRLNSSHSS